MQFLFDSYPYESQRRITRLLLGLLPDVMTEELDDGEEMESELFEDEDDEFRRVETRQLWHVFELKTITVRRPFIVFVLIELMENRWRGAQAIETARELLLRLQPVELQLAFYVDRRLAEFVRSTEDWLRDEKDREDPNLVSSITNIVNRIKKENQSAEFKVNSLSRSLTKQRTQIGSVTPHGIVPEHPVQKAAHSDLDLSDDSVG